MEPSWSPISFYKISSLFKYLPSFSSFYISIIYLFRLLYSLWNIFRYVDIPEGSLLVLLSFTEWLNLFTWINFNFFVNSSKILAPVIYILLTNI